MRPKFLKSEESIPLMAFDFETFSKRKFRKLAKLSIIVAPILLQFINISKIWNSGFEKNFAWTKFLSKFEVVLQILKPKHARVGHVSDHLACAPIANSRMWKFALSRFTKMCPCRPYFDRIWIQIHEICPFRTHRVLEKSPFRQFFESRNLSV